MVEPKLFTIIIFSLWHTQTWAQPNLAVLVPRVEALIAQDMPRLQIPSMAVALIRGSDIVYEKGFGQASQLTGYETTENTVFQMASISKPMAAYGIMKLYEDGKIDLDAPVETYLTRWSLPQTQYDNSQVTLRRILSHTGGLGMSGYAGYYTHIPDIVTALDSEKETCCLNPSTFEPGQGDTRVIFPPGTRFSYSGGGYQLCQLIIEEVSGRSFTEFMQTEILDPMGLTMSSFDWNSKLQAHTAESACPLTLTHCRDFTTAATFQRTPNFLFSALAAAGWYSTAHDMAVWVAKTLNGTTPLKPETVELMMERVPNSENPPSGSYGLGYSRFDGRTGPYIGHSGSNIGWKLEFGFIPHLNEGIVVMTASETGYELVESIRTLWGQWLGEIPQDFDGRHPFANIVRHKSDLLEYWK